MKNTKEYGEFFPIEFSGIPYNYSIAHLYFPMSEEEIKSKGLKWQEYEAPDAVSIENNELPDALPETDRFSE